MKHPLQISAVAVYILFFVPLDSISSFEHKIPQSYTNSFTYISPDQACQLRVASYRPTRAQVLTKDYSFISQHNLRLIKNQQWKYLRHLHIPVPIYPSTSFARASLFMSSVVSHLETLMSQDWESFSGPAKHLKKTTINIKDRKDIKKLRGLRRLTTALLQSTQPQRDIHLLKSFQHFSHLKNLFLDLGYTVSGASYNLDKPTLLKYFWETQKIHALTSLKINLPKSQDLSFSLFLFPSEEKYFEKLVQNLKDFSFSLQWESSPLSSSLFPSEQLTHPLCRSLFKIFQPQEKRFKLATYLDNIGKFLPNPFGLAAYLDKRAALIPKHQEPDTVLVTFLKSLTHLKISDTSHVPLTKMLSLPKSYASSIEEQERALFKFSFCVFPLLEKLQSFTFDREDLNSALDNLQNTENFKLLQNKLQRLNLKSLEEVRLPVILGITDEILNNPTATNIKSLSLYQKHNNPSKEIEEKIIGVVLAKGENLNNLSTLALHNFSWENIIRLLGANQLNIEELTLKDCLQKKEEFETILLAFPWPLKKVSLAQLPAEVSLQIIIKVLENAPYAKTTLTALNISLHYRQNNDLKASLFNKDIFQSLTSVTVTKGSGCPTTLTLRNKRPAINF